MTTLQELDINIHNESKLAMDEDLTAEERELHRNRYIELCHIRTDIAAPYQEDKDRTLEYVKVVTNFAGSTLLHLVLCWLTMCQAAGGLVMPGYVKKEMNNL